MKTKLQSILKGAVFAALATVSEGVTIVIDPLTGLLNSTRWEGYESAQSEINCTLDSIVAGISSQLVYKQDVGGGESGPLAGSYTAAFTQTPSEPSQATITYDGGDFVGPVAYLVVKDGKHVPAWYFYDLTALGWNGTDTLSLTGFWPGGGAISHVSLYGSGQGDVPDGGSTLILLGTAFLASASLRRWLACQA